MYAINLEIRNTLNEIKTVQSKMKGLSAMKGSFTIATFFIYLSFTSVLFAGVSIWGLQDYLIKHGANYIALLWVIVVIVFVPMALSLGKHFNYDSIGSTFTRYNIIGMVIYSLIALAVISGVYYESISSSANLQAKAMNAVDYKSNLSNILNSGNVVTSDSALSSELTNASVKLAQCQERLKQGKEKHCEGAKAKVSALKAQTQDVLKASSESSVNSVNAKADVLKGAVDEQSLPAAKWVAETLNTSNDVGTMVIVIIAAIFFELIHLTTVYTEYKWHEKLTNLKEQDKMLQTEYFNKTGKVYNPADFKDDRVIDLSKDELTDKNQPQFTPDSYEIRTKGKPYEVCNIGFTSQPQATRFKWQDGEPDTTPPPVCSFGFIPNTAKAESNQQVHGKNVASVSTQNASVSTQKPSVSTQKPAHGKSDGLKGTNTATPKEPLYTKFSEIPLYEIGLCKWCGTPLTGVKNGAKFCTVDHKDKFWNLYKPANRRLNRDTV